MGETRWDLTIWLWSHSIRASAVESGTWQRSPSLSSASIISSRPRKSSTRCSARRPPMKGEVGDWQSKMPLEYSSAFEPGRSKIAQAQAGGKQVRHTARLRDARRCLLPAGVYLNQTQRWWWILPTPRSNLEKGKPLLACYADGGSSRKEVGWSDKGHVRHHCAHGFKARAGILLPEIFWRRKVLWGEQALLMLWVTL